MDVEVTQGSEFRKRIFNQSSIQTAKDLVTKDDIIEVILHQKQLSPSSKSKLESMRSNVSKLSDSHSKSTTVCVELVDLTSDTSIPKPEEMGQFTKVSSDPIPNETCWMYSDISNDSVVSCDSQQLFIDEDAGSEHDSSKISDNTPTFHGKLNKEAATKAKETISKTESAKKRPAKRKASKETSKQKPAKRKPPKTLKNMPAKIRLHVTPVDKAQTSDSLGEFSETISVEQAMAMIFCGSDSTDTHLNIYQDCSSNVDVSGHGQLPTTVEMTASKEKLDHQPAPMPESTSAPQQLPKPNASSLPLLQWISSLQSLPQPDSMPMAVATSASQSLSLPVSIPLSIPEATSSPQKLPQSHSSPLQLTKSTCAVHSLPQPNPSPLAVATAPQTMSLPVSIPLHIPEVTSAPQSLPQPNSSPLQLTKSTSALQTLSQHDPRPLAKATSAPQSYTSHLQLPKWAFALQSLPQPNSSPLVVATSAPTLSLPTSIPLPIPESTFATTTTSHGHRDMPIALSGTVSVAAKQDAPLAPKPQASTTNGMNRTQNTKLPAFNVIKKVPSYSAPSPIVTQQMQLPVLTQLLHEPSNVAASDVNMKTMPTLDELGNGSQTGNLSAIWATRMKMNLERISLALDTSPSTDVQSSQQTSVLHVRKVQGTFNPPSQYHEPVTSSHQMQKYAKATSQTVHYRPNAIATHIQCSASNANTSGQMSAPRPEMTPNTWRQIPMSTTHPSASQQSIPANTQMTPRSMGMANPRQHVPTASGQYAMQQPTSSGQCAMPQPTASGQYAMKQPTTSGQYAMQQPTTSGQYAMQQPTTSGQYAMQQPTASGQYVMQQSSMSVSSGSACGHLAGAPAMDSSQPSHGQCQSYFLGRYQPLRSAQDEMQGPRSMQYANFSQAAPSSYSQQLSTMASRQLNADTNQVYAGNSNPVNYRQKKSSTKAVKRLKSNNSVHSVAGPAPPMPAPGQLSKLGQYHTLGYPNQQGRPTQESMNVTSQEWQMQHATRPQPGPVTNPTHYLQCNGNPCTNPQICNSISSRYHPTSVGAFPPPYAYQATNSSYAAHAQDLSSGNGTMPYLPENRINHLQSNTQHLQGGQNINCAMSGESSSQSHVHTNNRHSAFTCLNQSASFPPSSVAPTYVNGPAASSHCYMYVQAGVHQRQASQISECTPEFPEKIAQVRQERVKMSHEIAQRNRREYLGRCEQESQRQFPENQAVQHSGNQPSACFPLDMTISPHLHIPEGRLDIRKGINFARVGDSPGGSAMMDESKKLDHLETPEFWGVTYDQNLEEEVNVKDLTFEEKWKQVLKRGAYLATQLPFFLQFAAHELGAGRATLEEIAIKQFDFLCLSAGFGECLTALYEQHYFIKAEPEQDTNY